MPPSHLFDLDPDKLKKLRFAANFTQEALASKIGIDVDSISNWERGGVRPQSRLAEKLAKALSCKVEDLKKGDTANEASQGSSPVKTIYQHNASKASNRKIVIGCFEYPPFCFRSTATNIETSASIDDTMYLGPWFEMSKQLVKHFNWIPEYRFISPSAFADSRLDAYDLVVGLFETKRRASRFTFVSPLHRIALQAICRHDLPSITKGDLVKGGLKLIVQPGEVGWEYVTDELQRKGVKYDIAFNDTPTTLEALEMLALGRRDVAIADEVSCEHFLRMAGNAQKFKYAFSRPLDMFKACVAVKKDSGLNVGDIDTAARSIRNRLEYRDLEAAFLAKFPDIEPLGLE